YALGAATVSIAWSEYLNNLLGGAIPYEWCHSPFEVSAEGIRGFVNAPALLILVLITLVLVKGTQESARLNAVIVFVKVAIVLLFIAIGWQYINPENHTPYLIPEGKEGHEGIFKWGWGGVLGGAAIVFFAFIGFDAVSTAAQEAKNPKRDMPIGILGSLVVCTILYILFSHVLTGVANWEEFKTSGKEASVAYAIQKYMIGYDWLATAITVAILAGFSSVILVMLMGQSRVFYSMSKDGLLPKVFSDLHPKFSTPYKSNYILLIFVGLFGGFVPGTVAGDLTSIGTLFAFVLVCYGVMIMRKTDPNISRPFKTPLVPFVPILGIIVCSSMIISLPFPTLTSAFIWMVLGLVIYYAYSKNHSKIRNGK
ncbi:MAG: amino acid permease, partial [bacterium]